MMVIQDPVLAELQKLYKANPPRKPTQKEIDDQMRYFEKTMNRVSRWGGIFLPTESGDEITTLPPQVGLDYFMEDLMTQINTYGVGNPQDYQGGNP